MSKSLETLTDFPVPSRRPRGKTTQVKREKKKQGTEAAAIAYVQMENNEYRYPEGARKQHNADGTPAVNTREVMRRAGYAPGSIDHFDDYLGSTDEFWELVELHRLRRTDPMFRKDQESGVWAEIGSESLKYLYERVKYSPHSLSVAEHIKVLTTILDAGINFKKYGDTEPSKAASLLADIEDEDKRNKLIGDYEKNLTVELEAVERLKMAHRAADGD
jgi:hypothetical protein